jgi:asparagine synthetase B (glutamine-hydrolysing)
MRQFPSNTEAGVISLNRDHTLTDEHLMKIKARVFRAYQIKPKLYSSANVGLFELFSEYEEQTVFHDSLTEKNLQISVKLNSYVRTPIESRNGSAIRINTEADATSISVQAIGCQSIYFSLQDSLLYWGTDPGLVATMSTDSLPSLDHSYAMTFLADGPHLSVQSPFMNVYHIPFGCCARFLDGTFTLTPIRDLFAASNALGCTSGTQWNNECLAAVSNPIRTVLEEVSRVGIFVSGGIDSSILFSLARKMSPGNCEIVPIHLKYTGSPTSDERCFFQQLLDVDKTAILIDMEKALRINGQTMPSTVPLYPEPHREFLTAGMWLELKPILEQLGIKRLISGFGGDQVFMAQTAVPLHLLSRKYLSDPFAWCRELYTWASKRNLPVWHFVRLLLNDLPKPTKVLRGRKLKRNLQAIINDESAIESWLLPLLCTVPTCRRLQALAFIHMSSAVERALNDRFIEVHYPFAERRMLDFALSMPIEQHLGDGWDRLFERRFASFLDIPKIISWRDTKGGLIEPMIRACRKHFNELTLFLSDSNIVRIGLGESREYKEVLMNAVLGDSNSADLFLNAYMLELWIDTRPELRD